MGKTYGRGLPIREDSKGSTLVLLEALDLGSSPIALEWEGRLCPNTHFIAEVVAHLQEVNFEWDLAAIVKSTDSTPNTSSYWHS